MKQYLLWWLTFILLVSGMIVGYVFDGVAFINSHDHTGLSFGILGLISLVTVILGIRFHRVVQGSKHFSLRYYHFLSRVFPGIGLAGTIIGFITIFSSAGNSAQLYDAIVAGVGTAFFTTLLGVASGFICELEALLVEDYYEEQSRSHFVSRSHA